VAEPVEPIDDEAVTGEDEGKQRALDEFLASGQGDGMSSRGIGERFRCSHTFVLRRKRALAEARGEALPAEEPDTDAAPVMFVDVLHEEGALRARRGELVVELEAAIAAGNIASAGSTQDAIEDVDRQLRRTAVRLAAARRVDEQQRLDTGIAVFDERMSAAAQQQHQAVDAARQVVSDIRQLAASARVLRDALPWPTLIEAVFDSAGERAVGHLRAFAGFDLAERLRQELVVAGVIDSGEGVPHPRTFAQSLPEAIDYRVTKARQMALSYRPKLPTTDTQEEP
jgi:hypothetical protein